MSQSYSTEQQSMKTAYTISICGLKFLWEVVFEDENDDNFEEFLKLHKNIPDQKNFDSQKNYFLMP